MRSTSSISRRRLRRPLPREPRKIARGRYNRSPSRRNFMKTTFCPPSTTTGSRRCAKTTGGGSPRCLHRLATLFEEQKEYAAAIPWAERLVALDSLCEAHHQLLIRLHAANHDRSSALRAYHQCMRVLRREMGVEPGPATLELFERILKAEPGAPRAGIRISAPRRSRSRNCRKRGHWLAARWNGISWHRPGNRQWRRVREWR